MKISDVTIKDFVMIRAFETMRKLALSKGTKEQKEIAISEVFAKANTIIDALEGK
jgi:hypothetical protein